MNILGVNAYHADASAVLVADGVLVAAVEEERLRRIKHVAGVPTLAVRAVLEGAGLRLDDVDAVAVSRNPKAHLLAKALFALRHRPHPRLLAGRLRNAGRVNDLATTLAAEHGADVRALRRRMRWVEHHPAHLASTFFVSPYDEAAVCAIDGFGDFVSTSSARGSGARLTEIRRTFFPHSLGLVYLALTQFLGFWSYGDEYKVMGLAPYGLPDYADRVRRLIRLERDGRFTIDLSYFRHWSEGVPMTWDDGVPHVGPTFTDELERLLGPARRPDEPVTDRHRALAASLQLVFEETAFHVLNALHQRTRLPRLCVAGGCGMNSVMNGKIREHTPFREVYVQPASADSGTALGAAFHVWHQVLGHPRAFVMDHAYWGPEAADGEIAAALARERVALAGCVVARIDDDDDRGRWAAQRIAAGDIVGWFQGRMEWGPRALGNRSILADPRRADMRERINARIKRREPFRPFAPSILEEALDDFFTGAVRDPFMAQVYPVRKDKRDVIPAVTHVDGSGRVQTVSRHTNPRYWTLIKSFEAITGVPVVLNTSFNESEPIVLRPEEAIACFIRTRMDALVVGRYVITRGRPASPSPEASPR
jgi:carbamoyltransferase